MAERPYPPVEGVTHRIVNARGLRTHIAEAGEPGGEPVLMVHGWPQHWWQWRHQIPPLSRHYRVIAPDLRGFGWTDAPRSGYDKETLAQDLLNLLDVLEIDRVKLVGHDWGGWCGFLLAIHHPERVERIVALNIPTPWAKVDLRTVAATWRFWYQGVIALPFAGERIVRGLPQFVERAVIKATPNKVAWTDEDIRIYTDVLAEPERAHASTLLYRTFLVREFPSIAAGRYRKHRLTTPTRLIYGTQDFAIGGAYMRGWEPFADDLEFEPVHDSGHFIAEEKPELVTSRILDFFGAAKPAPASA